MAALASFYGGFRSLFDMRIGDSKTVGMSGKGVGVF